MHVILSLLLSAICIITLSRITSASQLFACDVPQNISVRISDDEVTNIHELKLLVRIPKNELKVILSLQPDNIDFRANNVRVNVKGHLTTNNKDPKITSKPVTISKTFTDKIWGVAQDVQKFTDSTMGDCRLVLLPAETNSSGMHPMIANEIHRLAETCVELDVCQKIAKMKVHGIEFPTSNNVASLLSVCNPLATNAELRDSIKSEEFHTTCNSPTIQLFINKIVDIALPELIGQLKERDKDTISLSEIDIPFSAGPGILKSSGSFNATDGTFRDLTTLRRKSSAILSHAGMKFFASCEFGLDIANLKYDHYKLKYGLIKVTGRLSGDIAGVAMDVTVSADYSKKSCLMTLEHLRITKVGEMKIELTGLGTLNKLTSKLLEWITKMWRGDIIHSLEDTLRSVVQSKLTKLSCEEFRP